MKLDLILALLKMLPKDELMKIFLDLAEEYAKKTDNTFDDQLVAAIRVALLPKQP